MSMFEGNKVTFGFLSEMTGSYDLWMTVPIVDLFQDSHSGNHVILVPAQL